MDLDDLVSQNKIMGDDLRLVYGKLLNDCTLLHLKWREFQLLFASEQATVELLNRSAPTFFGLIQNVLWEDIVLHVARMCDPAKSRQNQNLSVKSLLDLVASDLKPKLQQEISATENETDSLIKLRNKWIAHRDFQLGIHESPAELVPIPDKNALAKAIKAIAKCLNVISLHYEDTEIVHIPMSPILGAQYLLHILETGLKADAEVDGFN